MSHTLWQYFMKKYFMVIDIGTNILTGPSHHIHLNIHYADKQS